MQKLVAAGPEKGAYTLIDSRPLPRFQEGTIPTAINLPYPAFDKFLDRLPKEKDKLLVFFCQGITCMMSPNSLRRAEAMGYTNVKVYREGWPEWTQKNYGVISPQFVKEAFIDKDIPHVMIDARQAGEAQRSGFIPGAVQLPADKVKGALKTFPDKKLKAPIMVYDGTGKDEAVKAAMSMVRAGYENVLVVTGGLAAWQGAGYALATGTPAMKVAYVPKPRPGSLTAEEFRKIAANTPADTLDPRRAQPGRGQRRHDQGRDAGPRRGDPRPHRRDSEGQAHRDPLLDRHPRGDGVPQAEGEGLQRRLPQRGPRHRQGRQVQARRRSKRNGRSP